MKFPYFLLFIFITLHLNAYGADYPRPIAYLDKKKPPDFSVLPKALMSDDLPVDPFCVGRVLMQPKGAKQSLNECAGSVSDVSKYWMHLNLKKKAIIADATIDNPDKGYIQKCESFYSVEGVMGSKVIVKTKITCDDAYSEQRMLGIIEQKNNQLINQGVIIKWNSVNDVGITSVENGIVNYVAKASTSEFLNTLLNHGPENKANPLMPDYIHDDSFFGYIRYKVDLNKAAYPYKPEVFAVTFSRNDSLGYRETRPINCIKKARNNFRDKERSSTIPIEQFSDFRAEVDKCIGPRVTKPKEEDRDEQDKGNHI